MREKVFKKEKKKGENAWWPHSKNENNSSFVSILFKRHVKLQFDPLSFNFYILNLLYDNFIFRS
jgi:hypothetical protein